MHQDLGTVPQLPGWLPVGAQNYLAHTVSGLSIRSLARVSGQHASTIMRQIRKMETRRDDPLIDAALRKLSAVLDDQSARAIARTKTKDNMMAASVAALEDPKSETLNKDVVRVLRRLCERGAVLAVAADMEKAVVVRESEGAASQRTAVVDRAVAESLALKEWISAKRAGRVTRYRITAEGRQALEQLLVDPSVSAKSENQTGFAEQHREWGEKRLVDPDSGRVKNYRYNLAESPLTALARRRDKDGSPFLSDELVGAGERLREDFELAHMGPRVAQNWDRFLSGGGRGSYSGDSHVGTGPEAARQRVAQALEALGPGLSDVVLRCCCHLEGLEATEKQLGWSARSGKIVLRIALQQLRRHYDEVLGPGGGMIG